MKLHRLCIRLVRTFLLAVFALPLIVSGQTAPTSTVAHVVIVSFDGGKPSVMRESDMPRTLDMASRGAATWNAQTVFPPITLISHTSMLTGLLPAHHHVNWNDWKPEKGLLTVPSIFQLARSQGLKTALFAGKSKFQHFGTPDGPEVLTIVPGGALAVANAASALIINQKPSLCFVHFADSDTVGHSAGWGSPEQRAVFAQEDEALGILVQAVDTAGIAATTTFLLTADHGGHGKGHGQDIPDDMTIPWIAYGFRVRPGLEIDSPVSTCDTAATALWLLGIPLPANLDGHPVTAAFTP